MERFDLLLQSKHARPQVLRKANQQPDLRLEIDDGALIVGQIVHPRSENQKGQPRRMRQLALVSYGMRQPPRWLRMLGSLGYGKVKVKGMCPISL